MKLRNTIVMLGLSALGATGCATKHLIFTTYTKVGLDVTLADAQPTQAMFGYKRYEGATVPVDLCSPASTPAEAQKSRGNCSEGDVEREAMSVYAGMEIHNSWMDGLEILQLFATGEAAVNAAKDPTAFAGLVAEVKKQEEGE